MEALLSDDLMSAAHKENVEVNISRPKHQHSKGLKPRSSAKFHPYTTDKPAKSESKASALKQRRALGDISNRQFGNPTNKGKRGAKAHDPSDSKLKSLRSKARSLSSSLPSATLVSHNRTDDEEEEIEHAYGGITSSSPETEPHVTYIREEIMGELLNNRTASILDDLDEECILSQSVGEEHESWWMESLQPTHVEEVELTIEVPTPDEFDPLRWDPDSGLLDDVLGAEIPPVDTPTLHSIAKNDTK